METLRPKMKYFGLLGNIHILVYYPIIPYQRIKVYGDETMNMEIFPGTMVSGKNTMPVITTVIILRGKKFW